MSELLRADVVELVARVRRREVKPIEIVDAHIAAILEWNPVINAVVANRFEDARKEAKAMEPLVADDAPPLFGVPCTIKESFGVAGLPHTSGSLLRRGRRAEKSATVVERVVAAGAIPLGVTNMPEMAMWMETDNKLYGRTNNPHDPTRTCGGSSGGEAAVVAAGASPFGVATDVGGSIRLPAFFCGVWGHKSSGGLCPATGHVPQASSKAARFVGIGPICRSARDLPLILGVLAGPDGVDPGCSGDIALGDVAAVDISELTVHVIHDDGVHRAEPAIRAAQGRAAAALEARGARIVVDDVSAVLPELRKAFDLWGDSLKATADVTFESWLGDGRDVSLLREIALSVVGRSTHTMPALVFLGVERFSARVDFVRGGFARARALKQRIDALLGDRGVILFPTYGTTAPKHGVIAPRSFVLSSIWNVLEVAATQCPIALDGRGLPTGVQVIARRGNDRAALACAIAIDDDLDGWIPPRLPR